MRPETSSQSGSFLPRVRAIFSFYYRIDRVSPGASRPTSTSQRFFRQEIIPSSSFLPIPAARRASMAVPSMNRSLLVRPMRLPSSTLALAISPHRNLQPYFFAEPIPRDSALPLEVTVTLSATDDISGLRDAFLAVYDAPEGNGIAFVGSSIEEETTQFVVILNSLPEGDRLFTTLSLSDQSTLFTFYGDTFADDVAYPEGTPVLNISDSFSVLTYEQWLTQNPTLLREKPPSRPTPTVTPYPTALNLLSASILPPSPRPPRPTLPSPHDRPYPSRDPPGHRSPPHPPAVHRPHHLEPAPTLLSKLPVNNTSPKFLRLEAALPTG